MADANELLSKLSGDSLSRASFSDLTKTLKTNLGGFLLAEVGNKIEATYPSETTEVYTYKQGDTTILALTITYSDSTKTQLSSVERTT